MLNSFKEAAAKQAAKLKEALDEAALQDAASRLLDRKQNAEPDESEELKYLRMENEALKSRIREASTPSSERESHLEAQLAAKTAEHEKLAEKSRELMIRYRKLQAERASLTSPEAQTASLASPESKPSPEVRAASLASPEPKSSDSAQEAESKLKQVEAKLEEAMSEIAQLREKEKEHTADRGRLLSTVESLGEEVQRKNVKIEELETLSNTLKAALEDRNSGLTEAHELERVALQNRHREELHAVTSERDQLAIEVVHLNTTLNEESERNAILAQKLTQAQTDVAALEAERTASSSNIANSEEEESRKQAAETELATLRERDVEQMRIITELEKEVLAAKETTENQRKDFEAIQMQCTEALDRAEHLQRELDERKSRISASSGQSEIEQQIELRVQLDRAERQNGKMQQQRSAETVSLPEEELRNMEAKIKSLEDNLSKMSSREIDLRVALDRAERLLSNNSVTNAEGANSGAASEEAIDLRVQLDRVERKMKSSLEAMADEVRSLRAHESILQERLNAFQQASGGPTSESSPSDSGRSAKDDKAIEELHAKLSETEEQLKQVLLQNERSSAETETLQMNLVSSHNRLGVLEKETALLRQSLEAKDVELVDLKRNLQERTADFETNLVERNVVVADLEKRINDKEATDLADREASLRELEKVRGDLEVLQLERDREHASLLSAQAETMDLKVLCDELERKLATAETSLPKKEEETNSVVGATPSAVDAAVSPVSIEQELELRVLLDRSERLHGKSLRRIRELEQELEALRKHETESSALHQGSDSVVHEMQEEISLLLGEARAYVVREIDLRVKLDRLERAEQSLQRKVSDLEKENARWSSEHANMEQKLVVATDRVKELEGEQHNRNIDIEKVRMEAMQGREALVQSLQEKEQALLAAEEMMKKLASGFDERSANEQQLKRELELERIKVEETELKMRTEFDKLKFELQRIFDEKAKQLNDRMAEAQQEAEAANIACSGFQRQLKEAHEEVAKQTRELDSLRERTRDALLRNNEEKKELQEKILSLQAALDRKSAIESAAPTAVAQSSINNAANVEEVERLQKEKTELEEALKLAHRVTQHLEEEMTTLKVELEAAQGILKSSETSEQRFVQENIRLKEEVNQLRSELRQRKERAEKLLAEKETVLERLNEKLSLMHDPEKMRATLAEEDIVREENIQLKRELDKARTDLEKAVHDVSMLKKKVADHSHHAGSHNLPSAPAKHPEDPASVYLKNVLLSYMCSRDPREQLGMVKAISQLAGFSALESEKIRRVLEESDRGVIGKFMGTVLTLGTTDPMAAATAAPASSTGSTPRVMKRVT